MSPGIIIGVSLVLTAASAAGIWTLVRVRRAKAAPTDELEALKRRLETGLVYEEDFIRTYLGVIRDEGFLEYFGGHAAEARAVLDRLIKESGEHKASLDNILTKLG